MMRNSRSSLLAAAALAMVAASPVAAAPDLRYPMPNGWAPNQGNGNNRREDSTKRHAKAKVAYKSKRAQRKKAKR